MTLPSFLSPLLRWSRTVRDFPREVRWFWQRGRRGWSDKDCWALDEYLSGVIAGSVQHLANTSHGYPYGSSPAKWRRQLLGLSEAFQSYHDELYDVAVGDRGWYRRRLRRMRRLLDDRVWGHLWD